MSFWSKSSFTFDLEDGDGCEVEGLKKDKAITALCVCTGHRRGPASSQAGRQYGKLPK